MNIDSWAIVHMVMPPLFYDSKDWISAARTRNEVPRENLGTLSHEHFHYNLNFNEFLRSAHIDSFNSFEFLFRDHVVSDDRSMFRVHVDPKAFIVPSYFIVSPEGAPRTFLSRIWIWVEFLRQQQVRPYWCSIEGVGIMSRCELDAGLPFDTVTGFMKTLPKALLDTVAPVPGTRMSRTEDKYVGGPISLVNHACNKHANCHFDHQLCALVAEDYIGPGQTLRYVYNSCEDELFVSSGFKCCICMRYFRR